MRLNIGHTLRPSPQSGMLERVPVTFDLSKAPYSTSGFSSVFLGNMGSGKSNFSAVMCEEFTAHKVPFVYFDNGPSAFGLRELGPHVVTVGNVNHPTSELRAQKPIERYFYSHAARNLARGVLRDGYSVVIDCSQDPERHDMSGKPDSDGFLEHPLYAFLLIMRMLYQQAQIMKTPVFIVVDEAQYFAPENNVRTMPIQKQATDAMAFISHDSRKAGIASLILGQRSTYVNKRILFGPNVKLFGIHNSPVDFKKIKDHIPSLKPTDLADLETGKAYLVGAKNASFVTIKERKTPTYGDTPVFESKFDELPDQRVTDIEIAGSKDDGETQTPSMTGKPERAPVATQATMIPEITLNVNGATQSLGHQNGAVKDGWEKVGDNG